MSDLKKLAEKIASDIDLTFSDLDYLYSDVEAIVEGKLRDRYANLIGQKIKNDGVLITITEQRITDTVCLAAQRILAIGPENQIRETAAYYREKYQLV